MTTKTNTKVTNANTDTNDSFNVITATKSLIEKGDRYNQAAIAAIAHMLSLELWEGKIKRGVASKLATDLSYDKGNISRIGKIVATNGKARRAALALDVLHIDDSPETLSVAVKVGAMFKRETGKTADKGTKKSKSESESVDVLALMDSWLREATDEQYAPRRAQVENLLATIDSERAAAQAEIDSQEIAA
jgi:hypothetical protein